MSKIVAVLVSCSLPLLSGCGLIPKKETPKFDAAQPAVSQAAIFVNSENTKYNSDLNKIAVASCNVLIGSISSGQAATSAGFANNDRRVESSINSLYYLRGISDDQLQSLAEDLCSQAKASLKAAGYAMVPDAEIMGHEAYQELHKSGKASPYTMKLGKTEYKVLAPKGQQVYNLAYLGTAGGLGQAFKAAAGTSSAQHETRLSDGLGADIAHIDIKVDFAEVASSGGASAWMKKDSATVKAKMNLAITGKVSFVANESLKCWQRFGKHECGANRPSPSFGLKIPLVAGDEFVTEIKNETSTGDKVGNALSGGIAMLGALAGGGGRSFSVKRTGVVVDPQKYAAMSKKYVGYFMEMVIAQAKS